MKKLLLLVSLFSFISIVAHAQCTPQSFGGALTNPDSTIADAAATQFYSQVIHVRVPADTVFPPLTIPVTIDSAGIIAINGLPDSLSYQTNTLNGFWAGNSFGCIVIQGMPLQSDVGTHTFGVDIVIHAIGQVVPFTMNYDLVVLDSSFAGFENLNANGFALKQNSPNPANQQTQIDFVVSKSQAMMLSIYNMQGQLISQENISAKTGVNSVIIDTEAYPTGIYVYRISNGTLSESKRMIIQ